MTEADVFALVSKAQEFDQIKVWFTIATLFYPFHAYRSNNQQHIA